MDTLYLTNTIMDGERMQQTILYARVSTSEQTLEHQITQASAAGFKIDDVVSDNGVSGVTTKLSERPQGRRLFDMLRSGDLLIVRWIDRLGRNYADVTDTIRFFMSKGIVIQTVINRMTFDGATTDPMQMAIRDAMISFLAASAQAQVETTKEAQKAGIAHAKQNPAKYLGRKPSYSENQIVQVLHLNQQGKTASQIARDTGLSRQTVLRITENPNKAFERVSKWGV